MNKQPIKIDTQQEKIKAIILECYYICKSKSIKINVSVDNNNDILKRIKLQYDLFLLLDENSEIYKGILNIARKALAEVKEERLEFNFKYIIEYFLTAKLDKISGLKSKEVKFNVENKKVNDSKKIEVTKNTKKDNHICEDVSGKDLVKIKKQCEELNVIDEEKFFDEEEEEVDEEEFFEDGEIEEDFEF